MTRLNELLIRHPSTTFLWRVAGRSMEGSGIDDGDILIVDRSITPANGHIVIAQVDNGFMLKRLVKRRGRMRLVADNPTFPEIDLSDAHSVECCGVVTACVKRFA